MTDTAASVLTPWSNFYIMLGTAAAALIGLMFVVITLVSQRPGARTNDGLATFSTPTLLHFCNILFVSATLIAPWNSLLVPATLLGLAGLYGLIHMLRVLFIARNLRTYRPDIEDWISYTGLPFVAYGAITAGALGLRVVPVQALLAIGGAAALLIFIGIRNAWDVVTFLVTGGADDTPASGADDATGRETTSTRSE